MTSSENERDASPAASSVSVDSGPPPAEPGEWAQGELASGEPADADAARSVEDAIGQALAGLEETPELPVSEHVGRFEAVHSVLADALNRAESSLSGPSSGGG